MKRNRLSRVTSYKVVLISRNKDIVSVYVDSLSFSSVVDLVRYYVSKHPYLSVSDVLLYLYSHGNFISVDSYYPSGKKRLG